jgi:hypothetical protein
MVHECLPKSPEFMRSSNNIISTTQLDGAS